MAGRRWLPGFMRVRGRGKAEVRAGTQVPARVPVPDVPTPEPQPEPQPRPGPVSIPAQRTESDRPQVSHGFDAAKERILGAARNHAGGRVQIVAESGYGKTTLLDEVVEELQGLGYVTLFVTAPEAADGESAGESSGLDLVLRAKSLCAKILADLDVDLSRTDTVRPALRGPQGYPQYAGRLREIGRRDSLISVRTEFNILKSRDVVITGSANQIIDIHVVESDRAHADLTAMQGELAALLEELARRVPVALLVDDLHWLLGSIAGVWLDGVLARTPRVFTVTARWPADTPPDPSGGPVVGLGPFSGPETAEYIRESFEARGRSSALVGPIGGRVFEATGGRPIDVAITCQNIVDEIEACDDVDAVADRIDAVIAEVRPENSHLGVRRSVDRVANRRTGQEVPMFDQVAVLRRFDCALLRELLGDRYPLEDEQDAFFDWLKRSSYFTPIDNGEEIRLHDLIRSHTRGELLARKPGYFRALHGVAERHYRGKLNFDDPIDETSPYASFNRYENPDWQQSTREWLYHAGNLSARDFEGAKNAVIRLFFEAFWWWDAEVESTYCQLLVADLKTLPAELRGDWVDLLDTFRRNYVAGAVNQAVGEDAERWAKAGDALEAIWSELNLRQGDLPQDSDLRWIYIITCSLSADVTWYGSDGSDEARAEAAGLLRLVAEDCTDESNHWIGSWAIYLEALLWSEVDPDRALELLADLPERIDEDEDRENRANMILLYADIKWIQGEHTLAFDVYSRAVLHFLIYHVWQEAYNQAPSAYTVSIYETAVSTVRGRLAEIREAGDEDLARAAEARITEFFAPYWRLARTPSADGTGLPAQPTAEELKAGTKSEYAKILRRLCGVMRERLEEAHDAPPAGLWTAWPK